MSKEAETVTISQDRTSHSPGPVLGQKSWKGYVWDTFDKPAEERRFLFKLDAGMLTFTCLGK